jgi:hypothetical protein
METRFKVGDKIYLADVEWKPKEEVCPDCLGQKTWTATLPNGETFGIECQTCHHGFEGSRGYIVDRYDYVPRVEEVMVSDLRIDTSSKDGEQIAYVCQLDGHNRHVYEKDAFPDKASAEEKLPVKAAEMKARGEQSAFESIKRRRSNRVGSMAAYFRRQVREGKKMIREAEESMARRGISPIEPKPKAKATAGKKGGDDGDKS